MTSTTLSATAQRWGALWGARAEEWAELETRQAPTYEEVLRRTGVGERVGVLDVGCGTGAFLRAAADLGARVAGLDASEPLLEMARRRVPEAELRLGELEALPFEDDAFDVVTGFNAFFFADDLVAALREARRVARPAGTVVAQVWGRPERCDLTALKQALAPFLPPPDPGAPSPPPLWQPGVLEGLATDAGLTPREAFDLAWAYVFPDEEDLGRTMLSPANVVQAVRLAGEEPVRETVLAALAPYREPDGSYRLRNEWHVLLSTA